MALVGRVLDCFLNEGWKIMYRVALTLLKYQQGITFLPGRCMPLRTHTHLLQCTIFLPKSSLVLFMGLFCFLFSLLLLENKVAFLAADAFGDIMDIFGRLSQLVSTVYHKSGKIIAPFTIFDVSFSLRKYL